MDFISAEEFLKQPKEIQEVFLDWWKLSIGDIFMIEKTISFNGDKHNFIECFLTGFEVADLIETERKRIICPLFTECQLRKFINKYGYQIEVDEYNCEFELMCWKDGRKKYAIENDLLQAYWKVACEIAKER